MSVDKSSTNKILSASFMDNIGELSEQEAFDKILTALDAIKQIKEEADNDDQLNVAKEIVKDLNGGYRDAMKVEKAKIDALRDHIKTLRN
jgi:polyhydroxyalkanoate synthesis regulator phasin